MAALSAASQVQPPSSRCQALRAAASTRLCCRVDSADVMCGSHDNFQSVTSGVTGILMWAPIAPNQPGDKTCSHLRRRTITSELGRTFELDERVVPFRPPRFRLEETGRSAVSRSVGGALRFAVKRGARFRDSSSVRHSAYCGRILYSYPLTLSSPEAARNYSN